MNVPVICHNGYRNRGINLGKALVGDATDDFVEYSIAPAFLDSASKVSFSCWVKIATGEVMNIGGGANVSNRLVFTKFSNDLFYLVNANGSNANGSFDFTPFLDQWVNVIGVIDGAQTGNSNRCKMWAQGIQQTLSFTGTIPATTYSAVSSSFKINSTPVVGVGNGPYNEIGIWDAALTEENIAKIAAGHDLRTLSQQPQIYHKCNGNDGDTILADEMGNHEGSLSGFSAPYFINHLDL